MGASREGGANLMDAVCEILVRIHLETARFNSPCKIYYEFLHSIFIGPPRKLQLCSNIWKLGLSFIHLVSVHVRARKVLTISYTDDIGLGLSSFW